MLSLWQAISIFPFLQNPSGQTTEILPESEYLPNSYSEIGDKVSGCKYSKIWSALSSHKKLKT